MNFERLKMLEQYASEQPEDPFPVFAMGLEWEHTNPVKALEHFDSVLSRFPDYLPVYYHAALLSLEAGDFAKARKILESAIQKVTDKGGESKALAELKNLYASLE